MVAHLPHRTALHACVMLRCMLHCMSMYVTALLSCRDTICFRVTYPSKTNLEHFPGEQQTPTQSGINLTHGILTHLEPSQL